MTDYYMETDYMKKLLMRLANTIVANLDNTEMPGLFNGKTGLCLFLYEYSRFSNFNTYANIASELLDDIFKSLENKISIYVNDGLAGIGCGIIKMFESSFLSSDEEDILDYIDSILLTNIYENLKKETLSSMPMFSSGIYLAYRILSDKKSIKKEWINNSIDAVSFFLFNSLKSKSKQYMSLLNSFLYFISKIYYAGMIDEKKKDSIMKIIKSLIKDSIENKTYSYNDIIILKKFIPEYENVDAIKNVYNKYDIWYKGCWNDYIYDNFHKIMFDKELIEFLNKEISNVYYDINKTNSKLAGAGLNIIKSYKYI